MKKVLYLIIVVWSTLSYGQLDTSITVKDSYDISGPFLMQKIGSCGSPDGGMLETPSSPANYQELEDGGFCFAGINSTNTVIMCFTFTPDVSNVLLNGGYSESCANNNFTAFNLYDNSCSFVSSSLNPTGLTAGNQYTWCVSMKAWGGGSCNGYTTFCPYWINNSPLPVELIYFRGEKAKGYNILEWETASEINNDYFEINKSLDGYNWGMMGIISGSSTSNNPHKYSYNDYSVENTINYYRLAQIDFNGQSEVFNIIVINNNIIKPELYRIVDVMGVEVIDTVNFRGFLIYQYMDGSTKRLISK